jgi:hypothetical protein
MLENLLLAMLVGGVTGVISHLIRNEKVLVFPKRRIRPKGIYLGFLADFLMGALAAVFAVTYLVPNPEELRQLIGVSILAGMGAENVLLYRELNTERVKVEELSKINDRLSQ